ncbi:MAG: tRNA pseudouridine(55) synthase TruB [Pseudomonadota bacterium]
MGRRRKGLKIDGIVLVDKPQGLSSNAVVQRVKRMFNAQKAGHTGALDPLATGMLPVCLGEATKFSQYSLDADKAYVTTALLGVRTDTSDADGEVVDVQEVNVTEREVASILAHFRGAIQQTPSPFSALKYQGKPLYYYARQGIDVPRPTRDIHVHHIELLNAEDDKFDIEIHCSKGTYIRTIVDDMGQLLGCGAHVCKLRRLWISGFKDLKMHNLEALESLCHQEETCTSNAKEQNSRFKSVLLPMDVHLNHIPIINLDAQDANAFGHGMAITLEDTIESDDHLFRIYNSVSKKLLGIATKENERTIQPKRVVVNENQ